MAGDPQRIAAVNKPCLLLIVISGIERFSFKGVSLNLVNYLTDVVKMSNSSAAKMVNGWVGLTFMMPLFIAPLADSCWELYMTIQAASLLYALGLCILTSTALGWPLAFMNKKVGKFLFLYLSLFMISMGQGRYNPSLQAFGADQLDNHDEPSTRRTDNHSNKQRLLFQWWYFGVCCGCLHGVIVM